MRVIVELVCKPRGVQTELGGIPYQTRSIKRILMSQQIVMHVLKPALGRCGLGRFGGSRCTDSRHTQAAWTTR
jgi:hypothetical protein